jgi:hypothetical protein
MFLIKILFRLLFSISFGGVVFYLTTRWYILKDFPNEDPRLLKKCFNEMMLAQFRQEIDISGWTLDQKNSELLRRVRNTSK